MEHDLVAARLAELGNSHRLAVYRFLVKKGREGATVGQIQAAVGLAGSTLSHHLSRMAKVGLIQQTKVGRTIICTPDYAHLQHLIRFLETECCESARQT